MLLQKNIFTKKLILCGIAALITASSVWAKTSTLLVVENNRPEEAGVETRFVLESSENDQEVTHLKVVKFKNNRPSGPQEVITVDEVIEGKSILPFATGIDGAILVKREFYNLLNFPIIFLQTAQLKNAENRATEQAGTPISGSFVKNGGKLVLRYLVNAAQAKDAAKTLINPTATDDERKAAKLKLSKAYASLSMTLSKNANKEWALYTAQVVRKPVGKSEEVQTDIASQTEFHNMYMHVEDGSGFKTPHLFNK